MSNRGQNRSSIVIRMSIAAVVSLLIVIAALILFEVGRRHQAFGLPWGPQPNAEAMMLRALLINVVQLSLYFSCNLFSRIDIVEKRSRRGLILAYYFMLVLNWLGFILHYFNAPWLYPIDQVLGVVGLCSLAVMVYIFFALISIYRNVEERLQREASMSSTYYRQLTTDALTELPNRMLFQCDLTEWIATSAETTQHAVLYLDLDGFKFVNDTLGHRTGDLLLQAVARRFETQLDEHQRVYRLGGDEFVFLLPELQAEEAVQKAQQLLSAMQQPLLIEGHELFITTSVGISLYPQDGQDADTLFRNADMAMYSAKDNGRNNYQLYDAALNEQALQRLALEKDLRKAIERDEFLLYYQPQVDLQSGQVIGMEALLRWQHPMRGLVSPGEFIPLAEETKLILPIGEWVLRKACQQVQAWHAKGYDHLRVSINLSAHQFQQAHLVATVKKVLDETGLPPYALDLEITESMTMHNVERAIALMQELTDLGIQMSIDDFGTSYSSLNYLKKFPIHTLKIDQSFVRDIPHDQDDAAIATAIIAMAHSLNLKVIAEGVETLAQLQFLRERHCNEMQGYFFSRPLPPEEFERLLAEKKRLSYYEIAN